MARLVSQPHRVLWNENYFCLMWQVIRLHSELQVAWELPPCLCMSLSLAVGFLLTWCHCPASKVSCILYKSDVCVFLIPPDKRSFKPRLHGELCEEDGGNNGEGVCCAAGRVQGGAVHAVVGPQPFQEQRSHCRDHTCACSTADDSSEYVFLDVIYEFTLFCYWIANM